MGIEVTAVESAVVDADLRMPFHFGNATITSVPQLFVQVTADVGGTRSVGLAQEGLSPLWFLTDSDLSFGDGIARMLDVVRATASHATDVGQAASPFGFWHRLYDVQKQWAAQTTHPPLLWSFGVSLVERAVIDAFCRGTQTSFAEALRTNALGIELGSIYDELADRDPVELLPKSPSESTKIRHTVGFTDPLTAAELDDSDRLDDGLPQTLETYVREHELELFKIKLSGDPAADADRLAVIANVLDATAVDDWAFTVDANEQYGDARAFEQSWQQFSTDSRVAPLLDRLLYVEQPLARREAYTETAREVLTAWSDRPPVILDESDGRVDDLERALACGYDGTSHKNCKGVFGGIANACLLEQRRRTDGDEYVLSGEDLSTVGPVGLLQDFAVTAALGLENVERNGHHYFRGLDAFPEDIGQSLRDGHEDIYRHHPDGFSTVDIRDGSVEHGSAVAAPFGYGFDLTIDEVGGTPLSEWSFTG